MSFPIEMLRCPISGQSVTPAPGDVLRELEGLQRAGALRNRGAQLVAAFDGGLLTADGAWFYPVRSGIPVMLATEAVSTAGGRAISAV